MSSSSVLSWPHYEFDELEAARSVLESGIVNSTRGDKVPSFEREFGNKFGMQAYCLANGTVALECALRALGLKRGMEVIVTPRSFIASASVVSWLGAKPVFVDINENSQFLDVNKVSSAVTKNTFGVIAVHFGGFPGEIAELSDLCRHAGIALIEDCAQALGAKANHRLVGTFGDVATWSFCSDKILSTAGEGGMIATKRQDVAQKILSLRNHGKNFPISRDESEEYKYCHESIGSNWRMTELQAAIGIVQLNKLPSWITIRNRNWTHLNDAVSKIDGLRHTNLDPRDFHSGYRFYFTIILERLRRDWDRRRFIAELRKLDVPAAQGNTGDLYREKVFSDIVLNLYDFKISEKISSASLYIQCHHRIDIKILNKFIQALTNVSNRAFR